MTRAEISVASYGQRSLFHTNYAPTYSEARTTYQIMVYAFKSDTFQLISGLGAQKCPPRNHCFSGLDNYWLALFYIREK